MALSQIQCLDDNHVNPRTHEAKPEFLYCEEQRLALEVLLRDGREAFFKQLQERGVRGFLSDLELAALSEVMEPYDPGAKLYREDPEDENSPLSLHYWPDMSDMSIPELDRGWPDSEAYRGVTRTTVYTQPPLEGQVHIKEVIRKMIAQAQKVIAVVMDVFTDVDIFRDLLDASYKRKVSVYILLERAYVPHFLSMCQRAGMHSGHLKNLRVRCSSGTEFLTHSCTKIRGHMGHRFMFIDGDKAVSGSYSFTWMSSRLDRNLITVVTGQAVDTFDRLFRFLYTSSKLVDLRHVATEPEPEPDPVPQPASVALPSAAVARKLYNPKYALVAVGNSSLSPSSSAGNNSPKESQKDTKNEEATKKGRRRQSKGTVQEAPPLHPGLVDLEKAYLFDYLPTWPEPDPPSDVIGFINIRDTNKPTQVHLQRSEMFEVSQAIRFSSPISKQKETLPEIAKPRNLIPTKYEENPPQQKQSSDVISKDLLTTQSNKENADHIKKEPPADKTHNSTVNLNPCVSQQTAVMATNLAVCASSPKKEATIDTPTSVNSKSALQNRNSLEWNQTSKPLAPSDSNSQIKIQNFSENSSSTGNIANNVNSTSVSANYQVSPATAVPSTLTSPSPIQPSNTISTSVSKPNTNSPIATTPITSPPVPKPRTVQLVIKDSASNGQKIPEVSIVKKVDSKAKEAVEDNVPLVAKVLPQKESETVPELANKSASKSIPQKSSENTAAKDCSQQKESKKSHEEQTANKGELQPVAGNRIIAPTKAQVSQEPIEAKLNIHKEVSKNDESTHLSKGMIIRTSGILNNKPTEDPVKNIVEVHNSSKLEQTHQAKAGEPQKINHYTSEENLNLPDSSIDRSQTLTPKQNLDTLNPSIDVSPIFQPKEILDPLNSPNDSSSFSKAKLNSLNSSRDSSPIVKPKKNIDSLISPIDKAQILKTKQNLDPLNSPTDSSPFLKQEVHFDSQNSLIDSSAIVKPKPNSDLPNSMIDRFLISNPKHKVDQLHSSKNMSPNLKHKQILESSNSPTDNSLVVNPTHLDSPVRSPIIKSKENLGSVNSPIDRSPILKQKLILDPKNSTIEMFPIVKLKQNQDSVNSPIDSSTILNLKHNFDSPNPLTNSATISKLKQNIESLNSPIEKSPVSKAKQSFDPQISPINKSPILKQKDKLDVFNSSIDSAVIAKPKQDRDLQNLQMSLTVQPKQNLNPPNSSLAQQKSSSDPPNSPIDSSPTFKPKQNKDSINSAIDKSPNLKPKRSEIKATIALGAQLTEIFANKNVSPTKLHSPLDSSLISQPKQNLETINYQINKSPILKSKRSDLKASVAVDAQPVVNRSVLYTQLKSDTSLSPRELPEKPMYLHLNNSDLTIPDKDSRTLLTQRHSPILDGFPARVPTPESRRSRTPDFRTPTSDFSDGYGSTTSDEFYECSESPFHESPSTESKDQVPFYSLNAKEDNEIHIARSSGSYKEEAGTLSIEKSLSSCETLNLSTKGSLSSIVEKLEEEEKLKNYNMQKEPKRADVNLELQTAQDNNQSLYKSSKALNQLAVAEQSLTLRLNNEATEAKRTPGRELKPKRVYSKTDRPDRMATGGEKTALSAGGVERRETVPTVNKEPEGHKFSVPPTPVI